MRFKLSKLTIATLVGCMSFSSAMADTFYFQFSGSGATATGSFTTSDSHLTTLAGAFTNPSFSHVSALTVTVTGAPSGNGTFGLSSFNNMYFNSTGALNFSTNLANQSNLSDFNLFAAGGTTAPEGVLPETLAVNGVGIGLPPPPPLPPGYLTLSCFYLAGMGNLCGFAPSTTAFSAASAMGNAPGYGAARVIDANPSMIALFTLAGLTSNQQVSNGVSQTLPILTGGSTLVTGNVLRDINGIIQARTESNLGLSSGDAFLGEKHVWLKPFGSWFDQSNQDSVTGYAGRVDGLAAGVDGAISPASRMGVALAYAQANLDGNSSSAPQSLKIDFYQLIGYGSYSLDPLNEINYQVDVGDNRNSGQRGILFMGQTANSSYDTFTAHAGVGIGHIMPLSSATTFVPSAWVDYTSIHDQSYSETGAGVFNLSVGAHTTQQLILSADGKLVHNLDNSTKFIANAGVGYDTLAKRASVTATFAGAPGMAFDTVGLSPSPWMLHGGIGFVKTVANGMEITAHYDVEGQTGFINQTVSAKLRWAF